jgi:decaprenylphospho-beta-D-erythro-pentofuranosid-2-ulose 2-reductase
MRQQGQGTIVLLSSTAGQRPRRSIYVYGASKAGVDALAEGMAFTLRDQGVQVLTVRPGFVNTKMTAGLKPAPLSTTPGAVAEATVNAMVAGKELIWVPWSMRYVMIILKLIPRPIFRRLKI